MIKQPGEHLGRGTTLRTGAPTGAVSHTRERWQLFDVQVVPGKLKIDSRDPLFIDGPVWLTLGGREFPFPGWTDAVLSVLGSMGAAVTRALDGEVYDFYFFEGSYFVKLIPLPDAPGTPRRVRVAAVDDGNTGAADDGGMPEGEVIAEAVVPLREVAERHSAAKELVRAWAEAHGEAEVAGVLSRGYQYDASDPRFTH
ncbi:hypothetical protein [Kitasatospora aureofaciens]|uniref:hypothetical protein n=1 Tax=Kitasatospora aureofaciens TaxID=1894 RepID=UPI00340CD9E7